MSDLGMDEIPVLKGAEKANDDRTDAARFIVDFVNANKNDISILATGPLSNLAAAYRLDDSIFEKVNDIVLMGGVTEALIINGKELSELNLSYDPEAAECVLRHGRNVSVVTGNACLDAFFPEKELKERLTSSRGQMASLIMQRCEYWIGRMMRTFDINGFYNWDTVAAVYMAEPSLFRDVHYRFAPSVELLKHGVLASSETDMPMCNINIPRILDKKTFSDEVYKSWTR